MKRRSITRRLSRQIILLILCFSAMILAANTLLIRPLYEASIENAMIDAMEELRELEYQGGEESWVEQVRAIDRGKAFDITIEADGKTIYSSSKEIGLKDPGLKEQAAETEDGGNFRRTAFLFQEVENWEIVDGGIRLGQLTEMRNNIEMYVCHLEVDNGIQIYLVQPVEPILDSIRQANILLLCGTGFFLILASWLAIRIAKSFTSPIRDMQAYVGRLSRLDFSGDLSILTGDELEELSRDISGLSHSLEEALVTLEKKNVQLAREIRSQKRLISDASHELRTPLTLIQGYADEIAGGYVKDAGKQREYVAYISEESVKMKRLINEILELSRLESGRMELKEEPQNVKEAITAFFEKYEGFLEEKKLRLELDLTDTGCLIDSIRFEQVLANFLSNAAKYADEKRILRVWTKEEGDCIQIHFFNSGTPIPEGMMDDLWRGFYKADESRHDDGNSFGLGLSIVQAIQQTAGLQFGVYNLTGGVVFWFEVRRA